MAEIKPFRAWRYNEKLSQGIDQLVSPLFDVVSKNQIDRLYQQEYNSIHLSVPKASSQENEKLHLKVEKWKNNGIIRQDSLPGIYVYYQYFTLPGSNKELVRKGFIANMRIYDWYEKVLLRHENTIPFSVEDRIKILDQTQLNVSPTHGLYTDPAKAIEEHLDDAMNSPLYETEDYQGVRDVLAVIHDASVISKILDVIKEKQIILADGHHRYEGSLLYQKQRQAANTNHNGTEGYNFHMMYLTNTESDDLRILPTHRLISGLDNFSKTAFLERLSMYFHITEIPETEDLPEIILGKERAFGLLMEEGAYKIQLKAESMVGLNWNFPDEIKELDLTVLHYFVIEKCLGILGAKQRSSRNLRFERNFTKCIGMVRDQRAQCALITKEISIDTVKRVCYSGYTLPQKSTYFYPKVISGFLFSSIVESEFKSYFDRAF
ncbi:MAG: DUF1015 domain-containing protein [Bacteroidota bacterium]